MLSRIAVETDPVVPPGVLVPGPTTNHALPVQTFNCCVVVLNHKSPVTLPVGAVLWAVVELMVLNALPL